MSGVSTTDWVIIGAVLAVYVLPMVIAVVRRRPRWPVIVLLDLLAGWTLVGWVAALVWSLQNGKPAAIPEWQTRPPL